MIRDLYAGGRAGQEDLSSWSLDATYAHQLENSLSLVVQSFYLDFNMEVWRG
jgi:hypothetical protein